MLKKKNCLETNIPSLPQILPLNLVFPTDIKQNIYNYKNEVISKLLYFMFNATLLF